MKKIQLATWLQNKMVLAALLMVLVAGTAVAGAVALRNGNAGEPEETEPGYAFQTQEDVQALDQPMNQQGMIQKKEDDQGWLEQPSLEVPDPEGLLQRPDKDLNKDTGKESRPAQSDEIHVISEVEDGVEGQLAEVGNGQAEAETLVSGEDAVVYEPEDQAEVVAVPEATLGFQKESTMGWPVFGNVLLDYSMDATIYFPTLKQYKCNPGILIQAEVGETVQAAVDGRVTMIGYNEEIGNYIMMELGGDYTLCYGQLDEIKVTEGQMVKTGEELGIVAQPTKYYVVEGPNVYLEMHYQEQTVDPLDYIR